MEPIQDPLLQLRSGFATSDVNTVSAEPERELTPAEWLRGYLRRIARRKWLVVLITVLTTAAATAYSLQQHKQYDATATLYFPQTPPLAQALGTPVSQPADTEREANTNVALVTSPAVAAAVLSHLGLKLQIKQVLGHVHASVSSNSDLVSVTATESDPKEAASLANEFAAQYVTFRRLQLQDAISQAIAQASQALASLPPKQRSRQQGQVLAARVQQLNAAKDLQTGPAQVVQTAQEPSTPSAPHPRQTAIMGLGLGLMLAIGLALAIEGLDRRLKDEDEISAALDSPVLGALTRDRRVKRGSHPAPLDPAQRRASAVIASCLRLQGRGSGMLLLSGLGDDDSHAKVALGLAAALATSGRSVVVIQVGAQGSGLDRLLGLVDRPGLGVALEAPEQLSGSLVRVGARSLCVVGSGERSGATFEVLPIGYASAGFDELSTPEMQAVLAVARSTFDVTLLSVSSIHDALAFLDSSLPPLLVVRRNRTKQDAAECGLVAMRHARVKPLGVVITDAQRRRRALPAG